MYIKSTDLTAIQADVLTITTEDNSNIKTKYKLKTNSKIINTAINELLNKITNANDTAISAKSDVSSITSEFEDIKVKTEAVVQWIEKVEAGGDEEDQNISQKIEEAQQKFEELSETVTNTNSAVDTVKENIAATDEKVENVSADVTALTELVNILKAQIEELKENESKFEKVPEAMVLYNDELKVESNDQKTFTLNKIPTDANQILFFVNGIKYNDEDWDYNSEDNTIEWKNTEFNILPKHYVSAVYMIKA